MRFYLAAQVFEPTMCIECKNDVSNGARGAIEAGIKGAGLQQEFIAVGFVCQRCMAQKPVGQPVSASEMGGPAIGAARTIQR